jgi:hypothetical protein
MDDVGILYGHLDYFAAIWYILWYFGIFYGNLVYFMAIWYILWSFWYVFPGFAMLYPEKSGNTGVYI